MTDANVPESLRDINMKLKKSGSRYRAQPATRGKVVITAPSKAYTPNKMEMQESSTSRTVPFHQKIQKDGPQPKLPEPLLPTRHRRNRVKFYLQEGFIPFKKEDGPHFFATDYLCNPPVKGDIFYFSKQEYEVQRVPFGNL